MHNLKSLSLRTLFVAGALAFTALVPATALAQTRGVEPVSLGITAGVTLSDLHSTDSSTFSKLWGGAAGVFASRNFGPTWGLQIEALATQRGASDDVSTADASFRLTYLDIPVLLKFGPTTTNRRHFHLFTGPVPGFRLKAGVTDNTSGVSADLKNNTKTMDFGWTVGAGVEQHAWSLNLRYTMGLTNIREDGQSPEFKNRSGALMVGYRFR